MSQETVKFFSDLFEASSTEVLVHCVLFIKTLHNS